MSLLHSLGVLAAFHFCLLFISRCSINPTIAWTNKVNAEAGKLLEESRQLGNCKRAWEETYCMQKKYSFRSLDIKLPGYDTQSHFRDMKAGGSELDVWYSQDQTRYCVQLVLRMTNVWVVLHFTSYCLDIKNTLTENMNTYWHSLQFSLSQHMNHLSARFPGPVRFLTSRMRTRNSHLYLDFLKFLCVMCMGQSK